MESERREDEGIIWKERKAHLSLLLKIKNK
jgi:hypothetical protein